MIEGWKKHSNKEGKYGRKACYLNWLMVRSHTQIHERQRVKMFSICADWGLVDAFRENERVRSQRRLKKMMNEGL